MKRDYEDSAQTSQTGITSQETLYIKKGIYY